MKLYLGDAPDITGRAVCDNVQCQWSTAYHGQIETPGKAIIWENGSWEDTEETRITKKGEVVPVREQVIPPKPLICPVCWKGVLRYQELAA